MTYMHLWESCPGCCGDGEADPSAGAEQGEAVRSNAGLVMLDGWGCVVGDTAQAAHVFSREWDGPCQEKPGVLQEGAAEGFLCRKAGDGWDMGVIDPGSTWAWQYLYVCQSEG